MADEPDQMEAVYELGRKRHLEQSRLPNLKMQERREREPPKRRSDRLARSVSGWAALHAGYVPTSGGALTSHSGRMTKGAVVVAAAVLSSVFAYHAIVERSAVVLVGLAILWIGGVTFDVITGRWARQAFARERAWIAAQPFELREYEDCLADRPDWNRSHLRILLDYRDAPAPGPWLLELLGSDDGTWTYRELDRIAEREPGIRAPDSDGEHNQHLVRWFHGLVEHQLAAVHARYPLVAVTLRNELAQD